MVVKVLSVEDDMIQQMIITRHLASLHCEVTKADSGEAAIDLAKAEDFDVIIMDYGLGELNGYVTAQAIRKFKSTPIVWCSAHGDPKKVHADDFDWYAKLIKPYNFEQLAAVIQSLNH